MRITLGQLASGSDTSANLRRMDALASDAAAAGSRLIVFPEYATYEKPRVDRSFVDAAEPLDGPTARALAGIARKHGLAVVAGLVERSDEPARAYNTLLALGPGGETLGVYRKIHLFDSQGFRESEHIKPAPDPAPVTLRLEGTVFGLLTCYDLRFPPLARFLADAGAQVLLAPSSWVPGPGKADQWDLLVRARALDNGVFVAGVSQAEPVSIGRSLVADPLGVVVARSGSAESALTLDLPLERIQDVRRHYPMLSQHRL